LPAGPGTHKNGAIYETPVTLTTGLPAQGAQLQFGAAVICHNGARQMFVYDVKTAQTTEE